MLLHFGPLVSDARGSMGGMTVARNRSGVYGRARVVPVNPQTTRQSQARDRVSELQAYYRDTLEPTQRAGWDSLAQGTTAKNKLGMGITLTAQNVFIKINSLFLLCGQPILEDAPPPPAGTDAPDITISGNTTDGLRVTAISPMPISGAGFFMQVSPALNQTIKFFKGPWAVHWASGDAPTLPHTLYADTALVIGQRFHWRYRVVNAIGQISNYMTGYTDILA
jgi:hypothetical protein